MDKDSKIVKIGPIRKYRVSFDWCTVLRDPGIEQRIISQLENLIGLSNRTLHAEVKLVKRIKHS